MWWKDRTQKSHKDQTYQLCHSFYMHPTSQTLLKNSKTFKNGESELLKNSKTFTMLRVTLSISSRMKTLPIHHHFSITRTGLNFAKARQALQVCLLNPYGRRWLILIQYSETYTIELLKTSDRKSVV